MSKVGIENSAFLKHSLKNFLIRLRDYKKNFGVSGVTEIEDLIFHALEEPTITDELLERIVKIKETNEKIDVAILNFLTKIFRDFIIPDIMMNQHKSEMLDVEKIVLESFRLVENSASDEYSYTKKLEFLRTCFQAICHKSVENFTELWKCLKKMTVSDKSFVREMAKDYSTTIIKEYFTKLRFFLTDQTVPKLEQQIIGFCINELLKDWKRLALDHKGEKEGVQKVEILKQLEGCASTTLFAVESISNRDLSFLTEAIQRDVVFNIMQLTDIDDNSITALCVAYCEFFWRTFASTQSMMPFLSLVFCQTLLKPLRRLEKKIETQNDMNFKEFVDFRNLTSFLSHFIENKTHMRKLYLENDLHPFRSTVIDDVVNLIFKISKTIMNNSASDYVTEVTQVFTNFCAKILDFEDSQSHLLHNVPQDEKQIFDDYLKKVHRWEKLAVLANEDPKKFLAQSTNEFYITEPMEQKSRKIAAFLLLSNRVDSTKIIEILGLNKPLNNMIREDFVKQMDFKGKSIVLSLRYFFIYFLMVAESQVIERILDSFTKHYETENPEMVFKSQNALYAFVYSLIILNTDLYKRVLTERMTQEQFKHNCSKLNEGDNLPDELLEECYNSIKTQEIKYFNDRSLRVEENVLEEGWQLFLELNEYKRKNISSLLPEEETFDTSTVESLKNFNILIDSLYSKMIITKLTENIEIIVVRSKGDPVLIELLIEKIINACVSYGMLSNLDNLLKHLQSGIDITVPLDYSTFNEKTSWNFLCMLIAARKAFLYLDDSLETMAKLIIGSHKYRYKVLREPIAVFYQHLLRKIHDSSKFLSQARQTKTSFFDTLSSFLSKDDTSSEDDTAKKLSKWEYANRYNFEKLQNFSTYFQSNNYLEEIFEQTKYLPDEKLLSLYKIALDILLAIPDLSKDMACLYSFIIFMYEITMRNRDRVHQLWRLYTKTMNVMLRINHPNEKELLVEIQDEPQLIALNEKLAVFKKSKQKSFKVIQNCIRFLMLESSIKLLDKCKQLDNFDKYFKDAIEFLELCSLPLVDEVLEVFGSVINSIKMEQTESCILLIKFLFELLRILSQKNLDRQDVKATCLRVNDLINDFLLKLTFHPELKSTNLSKEIVTFLEFYTNSNVCKKYDLSGTIINSVTILFTEVMGTKQTQENVQNRLIQIVLRLLSSLDSQDIAPNFKTIQKAIGNIELDTIQIADVLLICDSMWKLDSKILDSNDEQIIVSYLETSSKIFLNFAEILYEHNKLYINWFKLLTKYVEMFKFARNRKMNFLMESLLGHLTNTLQIMVSFEFLILGVPTADLDEQRKSKQEQAMKMWRETIPHLQVLPKDVVSGIISQLEDTQRSSLPNSLTDLSSNERKKSTSKSSPTAAQTNGTQEVSLQKVASIERIDAQPTEDKPVQNHSEESKISNSEAEKPSAEINTINRQNSKESSDQINGLIKNSATNGNDSPASQTTATEVSTTSTSPKVQELYQKKLEELKKENKTMML